MASAPCMSRRAFIVDSKVGSRLGSEPRLESPGKRVPQGS
jgi:hypothetical protein